MVPFLLGLLAVVVVLILVVVLIYNKLVTARNAYKNAFSQISVQLTRRYDLIPNLVESVKAYLKHEHETFLLVAKARQQAQQDLQTAAQSPGDPTAMRQLTVANGALGSALGRLMMVVESYPELRASENIRQFNEELSSTENRVAFARQAYNDAVMDYNNTAEVFPNNVIAGTFGFQPAALLEGEEAKREVPKVDFSR